MYHKTHHSILEQIDVLPAMFWVVHPGIHRRVRQILISFCLIFASQSYKKLLLEVKDYAYHFKLLLDFYLLLKTFCLYLQAFASSNCLNIMHTTTILDSSTFHEIHAQFGLVAIFKNGFDTHKKSGTV